MAATARTIDHVFTMPSPWAYIGHGALIDIGRRRGAVVRVRPVSLSAVFPGSGGLPPARRYPSPWQAYRLVEFQRRRGRRGLCFALHPRSLSLDPGFADRAVVAPARAGEDPERFVASGFAACREEGRDLAGPRELRRLLGEAGHGGEAVIEAARAEAVAEVHAADTRRALAEGLFGSPSDILDGEVFWGQDRPDPLDDALAGGRPPFTSRRRGPPLPVATAIV